MRLISMAHSFSGPTLSKVLSESSLRPSTARGGRALSLFPECYRGADWCRLACAVAAAAGATAALPLASARQRPRRRRRRRVARGAGETIELFRRFGPEDDPFEIQTDQVLGVGGQGTVYRCRRVRDSSREFAVKAVPIWRLQMDPESSNKLAVFEKEMEVIQKVQGHPNIAKCYGSWDAPHPLGKDAIPAMYKMMVVELVEGGSLTSMIASEGRLDERTSRDIVRQALAGIKFMHDRQVLHRDLKCDNILVRRNGATGDLDVKLIDFGIARIFSGSYVQSCVGTMEIMAPEVVRAKLMLAPGGEDARRLSTPVRFASPRELSPGFGLATARPDGRGALVSGLEPGGQGEVHGVREGWAVARINGIEVMELPFLPDPEAPGEPSIVGTLQGLESAFTAEFLELPRRQFTEAVDFWGLGCVLYTMLAGKVPFETEASILDGDFSRDPIAHCSGDARHLINILLNVDPSERAGCGQVEAHPWLANNA